MTGVLAVNVAGLRMAETLAIFAAPVAMIGEGEEGPIVKGDADLLICKL